MSQSNVTDLEALGLIAAQEVAGESAVEQVEVLHGKDSDDRPVYRFSFLIDQSRARLRAGPVWTRIIQRLRDDLIARGDEHFPVIQILSREDWPKRTDARFG